MNHHFLNPVAFSLVLALTGAVGQSATGAPSTNFPPPTFDGRVDVGGHKLRMMTYGNGSPTVIIEAGGSQPGVENHDWKRVINAIAKTTRICAYDRAGLGLSDGVPAQTRTSEDMVKDLHALLVRAKVPGPYILVGHSLGGLHARLYASRYPREVVGLVLVDAAHPDQWSKLLGALPAESPQEREDIKRVRKDLHTEITDPSFNRERMDVAASAAQVRAAGTLGNKPLVVVTRSPKAYTQGPGPQRDYLERVWQELQRDLARLSSNSTHKVATKAGHFISVDEPQLVVDAILKVLDVAKKAR